ncbi:MAG TPA: acylphosphatase [Opitutus sp.]|nr:acylphosphatase [Opitutus sp.]
MAEVHHETVFFAGRVQGVGFRYTVMQIAAGFDVTGYVRNLPDGRVQLEAEGRAEEIAAFVSSIEERMHGYIRRSERTSARRAAEFNGFTIR